MASRSASETIASIPIRTIADWQPRTRASKQKARPRGLSDFGLQAYFNQSVDYYVNLR